VPTLKVLKIADQDVYKDIVRVPERYRLDESDETIEEATICWINGTPRKSIVTLRGFQRSDEPEIRMDDRTRIRLGVELGKSYNFTFKRASVWGQLRWAWSASETGYKVASRLAVIGFFLGVLAFLPVLAEWMKFLWDCAKNSLPN
jgi:hypothetical protein